jgi:carboxypeptidase C (cathepsin A)
VESQGDPSTDPVLLWTNGGPGCSGLTGFLTEHGPFRPTSNGTLELNPQAWNTLASMVYVEQPVGVGFSEASASDLPYTDALAASDNLNLVKAFFKTFPQFAPRDFYMHELRERTRDHGARPCAEGPRSNHV